MLLTVFSWQICCGHKLFERNETFLGGQTGKHLLRAQNVSKGNQKHSVCLGHKFCVRNKCCTPRQTGNHLCPQQCVLVCHRWLYLGVAKAIVRLIMPLLFHCLFESFVLRHLVIDQQETVIFFCKTILVKHI